MEEKELKIPDKLPLLEGLCWNIADPYNAIVANQQELPKKAILKANQIYPDAEKCLIEAIKQFQNLADYRQKCYQALQISELSKIINGIDKIALSYNLPLTQRSFGEIDFSYRQLPDTHLKTIRNN